MKVRFSRRALAQLDGIFQYIAREDAAAAARVVARIERLTSLLETSPLMGRPTNRVDVRVLTVPRYPYLIFYRILPTRSEIRILRVLHAARLG